MSDMRLRDAKANVTTLICALEELANWPATVAFLIEDVEDVVDDESAEKFVEDLRTWAMS